MIKGAVDAWNSWNIDEENLASETAPRRFNMFRHACLLDYTEKALLLYSYVKHEEIDMEKVMEDFCKTGHVETLKLLINEGLDIKAYCHGSVPMAIKFDHADMLRVLLETDTDNLYTDVENLKTSIEKKTGDILELLLKYGRYTNDDLREAAFIALSNGDEVKMQILIDHGLDVAAKENELLCYAAGKVKSKARMISFLAEKGADPHSGSEDPLSAAVAETRGENIAHLIFNHGADPLLMPFESLQKAYANSSMSSVITAGIRHAKNRAHDDFCRLNYPASLGNEDREKKKTALYAAVRGQQLAAALDAITALPVEERSGYLQADDFLRQVNPSYRVLDIVMATNQYQHIFNPALWPGRADEMEKLWGELPQSLQEKVTRQPFEDIKDYERAKKQQEILQGKRQFNKTPRFKL